MKQQKNGIEILKQICNAKRVRLQKKGVNLGYELPKERVFPLIIPEILNDKTKPFIIAEVKRKSPTRGHISEIKEPKELAKTYIEQGASAISVLCEEDYFYGSLQDLHDIKSEFPHACILRKDFILYKDEVRVSYLVGADIVLLIVTLFADNMESFCEIYDELLKYNLTPFIEIHTIQEWNLIKNLNLEKAIIGINTRNLKTFNINKMDAMKLRAQMPKHIPVIFESGIQSNYDSFIAGSSGFQGILCGSFLVATLDRDDMDGKDFNHSGVLKNLIKAFSIGAKKRVFSNLVQRFHAKNQNAKNLYKPLIKVCGINDIEFLRESFLYADLIGFILTEKSVRYVDRAFLQEATKCYEACRLQDFMPLRVGVVTRDCVLIGKEYLECGFIDCLQLHDMPISFCLDEPLSKNIEKSRNTESCYGEYSIRAYDLQGEILPFYPSINYKLLDSKTLQTNFCLWDSSGGNGENLDIAKIQTLLKNHTEFKGNLWLAGGILAKNLRTLLTLNPMLLDICSGFESERGKKSVSYMRDFFALLDDLVLNSLSDLTLN